MIKIRLHGTSKEVQKAVEQIEDGFEILEISKPYQDKGESKLVRLYIDAKNKKRNIKK